METIDKAQAMRDYMAQTTGSEHQWQHWARMLRYTDGIKFMADTLGAHWLVDIVASYQPTLRGETFQVWRIERHVGEVIAVSAWNDTPHDADSKRLCWQRVASTDFPTELMPFEFYVEHGVALLKAER